MDNRAIDVPNGAPQYDVDFYSDDFIRDPLPHYAVMRELGPVVYLPRPGNFAITQYKEIREALRNHEVFSSAEGVCGDEESSARLIGPRSPTLMTDPPEHDFMRTVIAAPLLPGALEAIRSRIEAEADGLIDRLVEQGAFDGVADLACYLPLKIVTALVGLPEEGQNSMLRWAAGAFDALGVLNERGRRGLETALEMREYINVQAVPERVKHGSWIDRIYKLADEGKIPSDMPPRVLRDYIGPSLDTTISATGHLLYLLATNPGEWQRIRADPSLIPGAVNEAVRLGSPIRSLSRRVTRDYELGGVTLPAGSRAMMLFASANRDERQFPDPDRFDPTRPTTLHVGFGHGLHQCVGMHLAQLEIGSLLQAMVRRVSRIEVGTPVIMMNNTIRAYSSLPTRLVAGTPLHAPKPAAGPAKKPSAWRDVLVRNRAPQGQGILSFDLVAADGEPLSPFEAGAHIDVEVQPGIVRQYSLCNPPRDSAGVYRIAVLRESPSRGGSERIHQAWSEHQTVRVSRPRNTFALDEANERVILVAGGIGITPLLSMAHRLSELGRDFALHYCVKSRGHAAFADEIAASPFADRTTYHFSAGPGGKRFSFADIIGAGDGDTHVYCCGPSGFMDALAQAATAAGWPADHLHLERFSAHKDPSDEAFTVVAHRSGKTFAIPGGKTVLEVLLEAGMDVESSCCTGVCGTCVTEVVSGTPEHRDMVLTEDEKASNQRMAICCSRSLTRTIVLDL